MRVEKWVEVQRDMSREEEGAGVIMRRDALEECQSVTDTVGGVSCQSGWTEQGINGDNFLQECRDGSVGVPEDGGKVGEGFAFFG